MSANSHLSLIDGCAGVCSAKGHACVELCDTVAKWADAQFKHPPETSSLTTSSLTTSSLNPGSESSSTSDDDDANARIADLLRQITGHDEAAIRRCRCTATTEQALQELVVLCRRKKASDRGDLSEPIKCLSAVGSDHGRGVVGRMASGRAKLRDPSWPILPGFDHVPWENLARRIDATTAMVLVSPIDLNEMALRRDAETLHAIRTACDEHGAALVIDHRKLAPIGGGYFWVHDLIASVKVDAVIMSAGLCGGMDGGLLVLGALGDGVATSDWVATKNNHLTAGLIESSLEQWLANDWLAIDTDEFAVQLAERLANYETIRDVNVTGRVVGIEMDMPSADWIAVARNSQLHVVDAGEFAIALQPPLVMSEDEQTELIDRVELVFQQVLASESVSEQEQQATIDESESSEFERTGSDGTGSDGTEFDEAESNEDSNADAVGVPSEETETPS